MTMLRPDVSYMIRAVTHFWLIKKFFWNKNDVYFILLYQFHFQNIMFTSKPTLRTEEDINCLSSRCAISHTCLRQHNIITTLISIFPSSNQSHSDAKQLDHLRYVCRSLFSALLFQHIFSAFLFKSYFTLIF